MYCEPSARWNSHGRKLLTANLQSVSNAKLSEHFKLGEFTKSNHPEVYNIPSHEAIANMKRLCVWLEVLRKRYNEKYGVGEEPIRTRC